MSEPLYCSFCGKHQDNVADLIAGFAALICDECVELCIDVIADNKHKRAVANEQRIETVVLEVLDREIAHDMYPGNPEAQRKVIEQRRAIRLARNVPAAPDAAECSDQSPPDHGGSQPSEGAGS
jgi:hypothetical protein